MEVQGFSVALDELQDCADDARLLADELPPLPAADDDPSDEASDAPLRREAVDDVRRTARAHRDAFRTAYTNAGLAVRVTAAKLERTAQLYSATEDHATELLTRALGEELS